MSQAKKSPTQKRIERTGWEVKVLKSGKVVGKWGSARISADTMSDMRFFAKAIRKLFRLEGSDPKPGKKGGKKK